MILVVDNYDSFTYNLVDYFKQLRIDVVIRLNDAPIDELCSDSYEGVVLSPGPGLPARAGKLMNVLGFYATKVPILGICLGHQAIGAFFGGEIVKAQKPMHGKLSQVTHNRDSLFNGIPSIYTVVRYHSLICSNLPNELQVLAMAEGEEIMAMKHKKYPIYGVQFHPEAVLTEYGIALLKNWADINGIAQKAI